MAEYNQTFLLPGRNRITGVFYRILLPRFAAHEHISLEVVDGRLVPGYADIFWIHSTTCREVDTVSPADKDQS
jgi:hypothetical protein